MRATMRPRKRLCLTHFQCAVRRNYLAVSSLFAFSRLAIEGASHSDLRSCALDCVAIDGTLVSQDIVKL